MIRSDPSGPVGMSRGVPLQTCAFSTIASVLTTLISNESQVGMVDGPRDSDKKRGS